MHARIVFCILGLGLALIQCATVGPVVTRPGATTPAVSPASTIFELSNLEGFPIYYYCLHGKRDLTAQALVTILDAVHQAFGSDVRVWFIQVHTDVVDTAIQQVTVFVHPLAEESGVRSLRSLECDLRGEGDDLNVSGVRTREYVQVLPSSSLGGGGQDVPSPRDLPFPRPESLSSEEIMSMAACARSGARNTGYFWLADNGPIGGTRQEGAAVMIYLGHGSGVEVTCRRVGDHFEPDEQVWNFVAP